MKKQENVMLSGLSPVLAYPVGVLGLIIVVVNAVQGHLGRAAYQLFLALGMLGAGYATSRARKRGAQPGVEYLYLFFLPIGLAGVISIVGNLARSEEGSVVPGIVVILVAGVGALSWVVAHRSTTESEQLEGPP